MDNLQIVYGLEKYFNFVNDTIKEQFVRNLINLQHHTDNDRVWALKEIISFDYENRGLDGDKGICEKTWKACQRWTRQSPIL